MKDLHGYTDLFLSPVTGSISAHGQLPVLEPGWIWLGQLVGTPREAAAEPFDLNNFYSQDNPSLIRLTIANPEDPPAAQYVEFGQAAINTDYVWGGEGLLLRGASDKPTLENAQNLFDIYNKNPLDPNILKIFPNLTNPNMVDVQIAIAGVDYLTLAQLEEAEAAIAAGIAINITGAVTGKSKNDPQDPAHKIIDVEFPGLPKNLFVGDSIVGRKIDEDAESNVLVGMGIMAYPESGSSNSPKDNVALGYMCMAAAGSGIGGAPKRNIAVGTRALAVFAGDDNVAIGYQALFENVLGSNNVAVGSEALEQFGSFNGLDPTSWIYPGSSNVGVGKNALRTLLYGSDNTAIGYGALEYASNKSIIGLPSGYIDGSVAIGYQALQGLAAEQLSIVTDGSVAIGHQALSWYSPFASSPFGKPCIGIGYGALKLCRGGSSNLAIGYRALFYLNSDVLDPLAHESRHIAIGDNALLDFTSSHVYQFQHPNLALGVEALTNCNSGRGNLAIGDSALKGVGSFLPGQEGQFCMGIGIYADVQNDGLINASAIGPNAKVGVSNALVLGGKSEGGTFSKMPEFPYPNVGIGTEHPRYSLDIMATGEDDVSALGLTETPNTPDARDDESVFYAKDGHAYVITPKDGTFQLGPGGGSEEIELIGDVVASGQTGQPINTKFAANPVFTGDESITIPVGTVEQRPQKPTIGMERFCIV